MPGYVPGEQPRGEVLKLNTNENPYPPSPRVIEAIHAMMGSSGECARRYPDPLATSLREALAAFDGVAPEEVVAGNGSDEILRLLMTVALESGAPVATLWPTYSYYDFLAAQCDAVIVRHELDDAWQWPESLDRGSEPMVFITNPNPPVGTLYPLGTIAGLCRARSDAIVVCDEAYIAFAPEGSTAIPLLRNHANLVVTRTFSKSHQLAGLRVGYAVGTGEVIESLRKVKDSYNVNALSQAAAAAAIQDTAHFAETRAKIVGERERLGRELRSRGFTVPESQANFVFAQHFDAPAIFRALVERRVFVRWFDSPRTRLGLRITVGRPDQTDALLEALDASMKRA
jgi:histidinol-phosphate aminotransferase